MKKIAIINGPNLNLLGLREPEVYGSKTFERFFEELKMEFDKITELHYFQSNVEGELIDKIQEWGFTLGGIVLNAWAYSHTSIALADAVKAITSPVIGVHISNIYKRETERHTDLLQGACLGNISGLGLESYALALQFLINFKRPY